MDDRLILNLIFKVISEHSNTHYVFITDFSTGISHWSKNAVEYFGLSSEYMKDVEKEWTPLIHPADVRIFQDSINDILSEKNNRHLATYRVRNKEGKYVTITCAAMIAKDENGKPAYFTGFMENHGIENQYHPVTNLYTYTKLINDLTVIRENRTPAVLLLIGIKDFSSINDIYGYSFGSKVLAEIGARLMREAKHSTIYHISGTKFAFLSTTLTIEDMEKAYFCIRQNMREDVCIEDCHVAMEIGAGMTAYDDFDISENAVMNAAFYALDNSKYTKYGQLVNFTGETLINNRKRIELINAMHESIISGCRDFYLAYQPIVDAYSQKIVGMETLLRWEKDPFGQIGPSKFIPWLESDAIFLILSNWVLEKSMVECRKIIEAHPDLVMNINLSYAQLIHSDFHPTLTEIIKRTGFPKKNLCLELTERCRMLDMNMLKQEIEWIRDQGIQVALDDFGTGFSSLNLLHELAVDVIKIDKSFIDHVESSPKDQSLVKHICQCADELGICVTVEGIETETLQNFLLQYPISKFQGYLYSKPVVVNEFSQLVG